MARESDLTFRGEPKDARLNKLWEAMPEFDETGPDDMIAGILFLDKIAGVYSEENYVLMEYAIADWLLISIPLCEVKDAEFAPLVAEAQDVGSIDMQPLTTRPFEISFTVGGIPYQKNIDGKTIRMRVMTPTEEENLGEWMCTMTADNNVVELPEYA